ncbi:hypothetical protein GOB86_01995 [Acetobacter lambici]|uniref:Uncharacterized protein n=1 Tax=Acetobacter lambici TaxID=1332824 RepID=A0ABT1EWP1_9PROT|nr:hypothetical protein [Acetobacter lambici]MCP1257372.1 hypothetical protein [Acetobacter lambici]NHO55859.1 hypothetical protein [Acetobacter lambici]
MAHAQAMEVQRHSATHAKTPHLRKMQVKYDDFYFGKMVEGVGFEPT